MKAKVYFSRELTPAKVVEMYHALGAELPGKVAVKVHSGERGNQNFLRPEFWRPMVEEVTELSWSATLPTAMRQAACGITQSPTGSSWRTTAGPNTLM